MGDALSKHIMLRMRSPPNQSLMHTKHIAFYLLLCTILYASAIATVNVNDVLAVGDEEEQHPDPNDENYPGMIYIGRMDDDGKRVGFNADNGT